MNNKVVEFRGEKLTVDATQNYAEGGMRVIRLVDSQGMPYCTATANFPSDYKTLLNSTPNAVFIKNYSENEGIAEALVAAGVIRKCAYKSGTGGGVVVAMILE